MLFEKILLEIVLLARNRCYHVEGFKLKCFEYHSVIKCNDIVDTVVIPIVIPYYSK
jgi:hypothetical protein